MGAEESAEVVLDDPEPVTGNLKPLDDYEHKESNIEATLGTPELPASKLNNVVEEEAGEERNGAAPQQKLILGVSAEVGVDGLGDSTTKKSKKRTNVWTKTSSRKGGKKNGLKNGAIRPSDSKDDIVALKPFHQEDDPGYPILLSKIHKAEKIELTADRLGASGSKGYRMVRATRGVYEGAWYFEMHIDKLQPTGHTRLGWSTRRGDIQAPVGYDAHSYSYRDVDGSKVHLAIREPYGEEYLENDYIGFYINIPRPDGYVHKSEEEVVNYKGQSYVVVSESPMEPVLGSEVVFFRNGVCQGTAFRDVNDATYFPAASLYSLPSQDFCKVTFNFGPDFRYAPTDLGDRPLPTPMCKAPGPGEKTHPIMKGQAEGTDQGEIAGGNQRMGADHVVIDDTEETAVKIDKAIKQTSSAEVAEVAGTKKVKAPRRTAPIEEADCVGIKKSKTTKRCAPSEVAEGVRPKKAVAHKQTANPVAVQGAEIMKAKAPKRPVNSEVVEMAEGSGIKKAKVVKRKVNSEEAVKVGVEKAKAIKRTTLSGEADGRVATKGRAPKRPAQFQEASGTQQSKSIKRNVKPSMIMKEKELKPPVGRSFGTHSFSSTPQNSGSGSDPELKFERIESEIRKKDHPAPGAGSVRSGLPGRWRKPSIEGFNVEVVVVESKKSVGV